MKRLHILGFAYVLALAATQTGAQVAAESRDGSFLLPTGEVITGGLFVEEGRERYIYMDVEGLRKGGMFEAVGSHTLRSVLPPGIEIEFAESADGSVEGLWWREPGSEPVRGARIYPHRSREVQFTSADGTVLQGRLLTPQCRGPHPAVIAVHGSGPADRSGGPFHTMFLQQGVAVLSYDKRGYIPDRKKWREPDLAAMSADAAAAVRFAARQPEIDSGRVGIFGSSQAGWVVPRAAVDSGQTSFIILRAGAAISHLETVVHEVRQELREEGLEGMDLDAAVELRRELYELAMSGAPLQSAAELTTPYLDEAWYRKAFGDKPVNELWSERFWGWVQRNYATAGTTHLEKFDGSVLWFLAEMDEAVPLVATRAGLERAFRASPGSDHTVVVLPEARHSFLIFGPSGVPRYSPGFFDRIASWMKARGFTNDRCWRGAAK